MIEFQAVSKTYGDFTVVRWSTSARMLAAPMVVHATYNAVVVAFQWNLMQHAV